MTAQLAIRCDAPGCYRVTNLGGPIYGATTTGTGRRTARAEGWTTTRVANPFFAVDGYGLKGITLDRCPRHARMLLRVTLVDDSTYRIEEKPRR